MESYHKMSNLIAFKINVINRLSPSALSIFEILRESEKQMTFDEIEARSQYSTRTVRHAIRQLKDAELIKRVPNLFDTRRCYYTILMNMNFR
jgi:DNA-binding MarR family transcriptional regulator